MQSLKMLPALVGWWPTCALSSCIILFTTCLRAKIQSTRTMNHSQKDWHISDLQLSLMFSCLSQKNKQINEKILGAKLLLQHWKPLKKQHVDRHDQLQCNKLWHETNPGMLSSLSHLIHITTCSMTGIITIQLSCTLSACLLRVLQHCCWHNVAHLQLNFNCVVRVSLFSSLVYVLLYGAMIDQTCLETTDCM